MTRRLPLLIGALGFATLLGGSAEAGRFGGGGHFSGGVHFSGGAHFGGGVHFAGGARWGGGVHVGTSYHWAGRGGWGPHRWGFGGRIYVGGYYPYYYQPYYYPEYVPSYYGGSYYPVQPAYAGPSVVAPVVARPELPRFGIGLFAGGVNVNNQPDSSDVGLLARFRLTTGLLVEGELGKTSYDVQGVNNLRVDRRLGGSLIYEIGAYNRLAPYVLVGLGAQQADVGGNYSTTQDFAEIGAGLRLAITPHFHIALDIRAGSRSTVSNDQVMPAVGSAARSVAPPTTSSGDSEDYTRGRLSAILYF